MTTNRPVWRRKTHALAQAGLVLWLSLGMTARACDLGGLNEAALSGHEQQARRIASDMHVIESGACAATEGRKACVGELQALIDALQGLSDHLGRIKGQVDCGVGLELQLSARLDQDIGRLEQHAHSAAQQASDHGAGIAYQEAQLRALSEAINRIEAEKGQKAQTLAELNRIGKELREYAWVPFYGLHLLVTYGEHGGDERANRLAGEVRQMEQAQAERRHQFDRHVGELDRLRREQGLLADERLALLEQQAKLYSLLAPVRALGGTALGSLSAILNYAESLKTRLAEWRDAASVGDAGLAFGQPNSAADQGSQPSRVFAAATGETFQQVRGYSKQRHSNCQAMRQIEPVGRDPGANALMRETRERLCDGVSG